MSGVVGFLLIDVPEEIAAALFKTQFVLRWFGKGGYIARGKARIDSTNILI